MSVAPATPTRPARTGRVTFPVVEVFGPTVQGEGPDAGIPAYFVRFGGCDWRCTWCDSMHAVDPAEVRVNAQRVTAAEIAQRLSALPAGPDLVVLSGGNPALLDLAELVALLKTGGLRVAVETQGSRWQPWLKDVDRLVISPKPPSSGMTEAKHRVQVDYFLGQAHGLEHDVAALKLVVFDDHDLDWAAEQHRTYPDFPLFLSAGTDVGLDETATLARLRDRFRWLCESVSHRPELSSARVLPQLHVIAWGTAKGV
jgi:7-carboxy-7-deazaguanine synthase